MKNDTNNSMQPTLWEDTPNLRATGTRSRGAARQHRAAADAGELWTIDEVANYLSVKKQTVCCWRTTRASAGATARVRSARDAATPSSTCFRGCRDDRGAVPPTKTHPHTAFKSPVGPPVPRTPPLTALCQARRTRSHVSGLSDPIGPKLSRAMPHRDHAGSLALRSVSWLLNGLWAMEGLKSRSRP